MIKIRRKNGNKDEVFVKVEPVIPSEPRRNDNEVLSPEECAWALYDESGCQIIVKYSILIRDYEIFNVSIKDILCLKDIVVALNSSDVLVNDFLHLQSVIENIDDAQYKKMTAVEKMDFGYGGTTNKKERIEKLKSKLDKLKLELFDLQYGIGNMPR